MQRRLTELGYRPGGTDGNFGVETLSAVTAFQKHEGLDRDGVVGADGPQHARAPDRRGPDSRRRPCRTSRSTSTARSRSSCSPAGTTILDVSTGSGKTYMTPGTTAQQVAYTPTGTFSVYRAVDAPVVAPLGTLYKPLYFKEGWAMHGEPVGAAVPREPRLRAHPRLGPGLAVAADPGRHADHDLRPQPRQRSCAEQRGFRILTRGASQDAASIAR